MNKQLKPSDFEKLIREKACNGASDSDFKVFMHIAKKSGLDPLMKQIYCVPRGKSMTIQTSIDGLRIIAERTGRYAPGKAPEFVYDDKGKILYATSTVKKMTEDGTWHEVSSQAFFDEYTNETHFWKKFPHHMLAKVAESIALRKAFPQELSGLYSEDEMAQASTETKLPKTCISVAQAEEIKEKLSMFDEDTEKRFLAFLEVNSIEEIEVDSFDQVIKKLDSKIKKERKTA